MKAMPINCEKENCGYYDIEITLADRLIKLISQSDQHSNEYINNILDEFLRVRNQNRKPVLYFDKNNNFDQDEKYVYINLHNVNGIPDYF